ncbi:flagellar hook assembly protein FlgD [Xenorhabdus griffiniae]|uniref:Basal-body rod modification protein FlgD n=1 Tax=Xenorhabdus griffiniae TaxID=351672 RepID=A0ABY9XD86_9GAMM|nr:flagellar hook assembly protein FlgD [Xenorhabdus griffiniae]MBD1228073.1 flagellar hook assembly protein FlgD [Xenorhabdus griffiniae]MBE8587493.1 flagellar hook assembly protein FlgD [Xenorhabdus griffiniae]WMV70872.1 flagellar hook assembly protein FlgD [Xenorhabdus griffiniae]WNH00548.1 flagellar hook assembly protein FlgD [Xenorhabdus griffiniae]
MGITASVNESLDNSTVGELAKLTNRELQSSGDIKDSFLKILVAQLQNQDPTNPMQNSEVTSQIAQISTVEGIEKLNKTLGSIVGQMDSNHTMQTVALIGRDVMVPGNEILLGASENSATPIGFELSRPADTVKVTIRNKSGVVVREMEFNKLDPNSSEFLGAGVHSFRWDGKDADGNVVEQGAYNFIVSASQQDQALMVNALRAAKVEGVVRQENGTKLDLGLVGTVNMDEVRQIL